MSKKLLKCLVLAIASLTVVGGFLVFEKTAEAGTPPEFNTHPDDPGDWFTGQVDGETEDSDPFSAHPGDKVFAGFYYHNNREGTVAENTRMRIEFPTSYEQNIVLSGSLTADNADPRTISDTLTVNVDSPQKIEFADWAFWYPADDPGDVTYIPIEKYGNYVEAVRGSAQGCWQYRGYVIFPATITNHTPAPGVDLKADGSDGPLTVDYETDVELTWSSSNADSCNASGDWSGSKGTSGSEIKHDLTDNKTYIIACAGAGGTDSDEVTVNVEPEPSLGVELTASPDSGEAPLENVDLSARVTGTATGDMDYKFDCENDGSWDRTYSNRGTKIMTAEDACDYKQVGEHTARVGVEREGLSASDTDVITVRGVAGAVTMAVEKEVRNMSDGEADWRGSTRADPGEKLGFKITIRAPEEESREDITVKDDLFSPVLWTGNLEVNGESRSGLDLEQGFEIDEIEKGEQASVTYEVLLEGKDQFGYGTTNLINSVLVYNGESVTDSATVEVLKTGVGGATSAPTGAVDRALLSLGLTVLVTYFLFVIHYFWLKTAGDPLPRLARKIARLKEEGLALFWRAKPWYTKQVSEKKLARKINELK